MPSTTKKMSRLAKVKLKTSRQTKPTKMQIAYLRRGLNQPGGKLPLFDSAGQRVKDRIVQRCLDEGWAEPWFSNPIKPDWLVCKLTARGKALANQ